MNALWQTLKGVLTLQTATFRSFAEDSDGLRRGVMWLAIVTLLAGSATFAVNLANELRPAEVQIGDIQSEVEQVFDQVLQYLPPGSMPPEAERQLRTQFTANFQAGLRIGSDIADLPTILPSPVGAFLVALGNWGAQPFARLGAWLAYALWVMLAAKLLGGTGSLRCFLAATSLYSVPQILTILGPVPCLGGVMGVVAAVWGWIIYIKATAVAHGWVSAVPMESGPALEQTDWGRAILAALLPFLVMAILVVLVVTVLGLVIALSGNR